MCSKCRKKKAVIKVGSARLCGDCLDSSKMAGLRGFGVKLVDPRRKIVSDDREEQGATL